MSSLFWDVTRCKFFFDCLTIQDESDILSRKVGDHLPTYAASHAGRAKAPILSYNPPKAWNLSFISGLSDEEVILRKHNSVMLER